MNWSYTLILGLVSALRFVGHAQAETPAARVLDQEGKWWWLLPADEGAVPLEPVGDPRPAIWLLRDECVVPLPPVESASTAWRGPGTPACACTWVSSSGRRVLAPWVVAFFLFLCRRDRPNACGSTTGCCHAVL